MAAHPDHDAADDHHHADHHHRNVTGGQARAAVFGASDGLVSNVALILGFAGAEAGPSAVRLAGLAGLVAGAVSMAAGEYVSMQAQRELLERELERERRELRHNPAGEAAELAAIYRGRGIEADTARHLADQISRDPDVALEVHAREELGVDPDELGSPLGAALSSFLSFAVGAVIPLLPWFLAEGAAAVVASIVLAGVAAVVIGVALARATERPALPTAARQLGIAAGAALVTWLVGSAIGVSVT